MIHNRLRILLISHTCQSATEGQPRAEALARFDDLELCVLVPDRWRHYGKPRGADMPAAPAYRFELGRVRWPWAGPAQCYLHHYRELPRLLRDFRPDVIDLWEEPWGLVSAQAARLRRRLLPGAAIVSETEQNIDKTLPPPFETIRRYTLRHVDHVVGRSDQAVAVARSKGFTGPATVVPNAVDAGLFHPMDRDACRAKLNLARDAFTVGYVGRLVEEKGLEDLADAMAHAPGRARLVLVGEGPYEPQLRRRVAQLRLGDRVHFAGRRALADLPLWINSFDALALPSRTTTSWKEQFGRVLIEAQACGIPVLGSDSGAIPAVIGQAGVVVPERDPKALAKALTALADAPSRRQAMGKAGRQRVEAAYTWGGVAARMRTIYQQAVERVADRDRKRPSATDGQRPVAPAPAAAATKTRAGVGRG